MAVRVTTLKGTAAGVYYTHELGLGLGLYYAREEEPPGRWVGQQADALGLRGELDPFAFLRLMAGLDPETEATLGRAYGESSARGYDVTFNAPKSVSLLAEFGDDQTRAAVLAAHDLSVDRARVRRGAGAHAGDGPGDHQRGRHAGPGGGGVPAAHEPGRRPAPAHARRRGGQGPR